MTPSMLSKNPLFLSSEDFNQISSPGDSPEAKYPQLEFNILHHHPICSFLLSQLSE